MRFTRTLGVAVLTGALVVGLVLDTHRPVRGATTLRTSLATANHPVADITDTYLFPSPTNPNDVVVVMDVSPNIAAGGAATAFFDQAVLYQMKFDSIYPNGGLPVGTGPTPNLVIQFSVTAPSNGTQGVYVYGPAAPNQTGTASTTVAQTGFGQLSTTFSTSNGLTVFAGPRADPSFFALAQFYNIFPDRNAGSTAASCLPTGSNTCPGGFTNPGTDAFASTNVLSIVVELPKSMLMPNSTGPKIAYWATTSSTSGN
ncbi:MAG TPA: DUF4331 family protein [Candidatus Baltobacteraceae bacterium]|jgi:hypothetical protein|nr:DUF4331 family protein [Candidatus Baltobacteraceae bacterium]